MPIVPGPQQIRPRRLSSVPPAQTAAVDPRESLRLESSAAMLRAQAESSRVIGQALGDVSEVFFEIAQRRREQEADAFASNTALRFKQETILDFEQSKVEADESADQFTEQLMSRANTRLERLTENAPPGGAALFNAGVVGFLESTFEEAAQFETAARKRISMREFTQRMDINAQIVNTTPGRLGQILLSTQEAIGGMASNLSPEDITQLSTERPSQLIEIAVQSFVRQGEFDRARETLRTPGLEADSVVELADLIRESEQKAVVDAREERDRLDKLAETERITAYREVEEDLTARISRGENVRTQALAALESNELGVTGYNRLLIAMEQDQATKSDPNVLLQTIRDVETGRIDNTELLSRRNGISQEDMKQLVRRQAEVDVGERGDRIGQYIDLLETTIGGPRNALGIFANEANSGFVAKAIFEFQRRAAAGENLDGSAKDIAVRYRDMQLGELEEPTFMVGTRTNMDVAATRRLTLDALDDGQITATEANQQATLIELFASKQEALDQFIDRISKLQQAQTGNGP